jgi:hypothetical protein
MFDFDYPAMLGVVQNQDSYAQGVAAQRPFYFDHIGPQRPGAEYAALTGRRYARATAGHDGVLIVGWVRWSRTPAVDHCGTTE